MHLGSLQVLVSNVKPQFSKHSPLTLPHHHLGVIIGSASPSFLLSPFSLYLPWNSLTLILLASYFLRPILPPASWKQALGGLAWMMLLICLESCYPCVCFLFGFLLGVLPSCLFLRCHLLHLSFLLDTLCSSLDTAPLPLAPLVAAYNDIQVLDTKKLECSTVLGSNSG